MGKILKIVAIVATVAAIVASGGSLAIFGTTVGASLFGVGVGTLSLIATGAGLAANLLSKPKGKKIAQQERLYLTLDTAATRKQVFGITASATDVRFEEWYGTNQEYLSRIICLASHKIHEVREIRFDDKVAWTLAGGVQGEFVGYLTVDIRTEGTAANTISINGGAKWGSTCRLTGCAYVHLRYKVTGNSKKTESPFSSGITNRVTFITAGRYLYDPRRDSTVAGGSGPQRADDQTTWEWQSDTKSRNLPLQILNYLMGWKINGKLAVGKGIPVSRLDIQSFMTAANIAEESVSLAGGGTEPRYMGGFVASEGDQPQSVLDAALTGGAGTLTDAGGKIGIRLSVNDLASIAADFGADDAVGPFTWEPGLSLDQLPNTLRGQYISTSSVSLYQEVDYPSVTIASLDGIERARKLDFAVVESGFQAQRIAKMELQKLQYQGIFKVAMLPTNLRAGIGEVVRWTFPATSFSNKLFRVIKSTIQPSGMAEVWFREENAAIYAWSAEEAALVTAAAPTSYNPLNNPLIAAALEETDPNILGISEKIRTLIPDEASREARYTQTTARATFLGLSFTALSTARANWVAYLATLSPAWNDTSINTTIVRTTYRGYLDTYEAAFSAIDQLISAEDAKWTQTTGRPPLLTGQNLTVDENFKDPSAWSVGNITFGTETSGEGYVRQTGAVNAQIFHFPSYAIPADPLATYEGFWDIMEEGAGAGAGIFYTVVQALDATNTPIAGDGSNWFYPSSAITVTAKGSYETHSGRFGRGTDRPLPAGTVKLAVGALLNYTSLSTSMRLRRAYFKKINTLEMTSALLRNWALGDGKALRNVGILSWGIAPAYGRTPILGPQKITFRFVGDNAKMAGLTESATPGDYSAGALLIYYSDAANRIEVRAAGTEVATFTSETTRASDEFGIEYDGLYLYPLKNGARMGTYKLYVGPGKSYRSMVDSYYSGGQGIIQLNHEATGSLSVIGSNTVDINGNPVSLDALRNNMIDISWWKKGAVIPWTDTGGGGSRLMITTPVDVNVMGLKGNPEDSMLVFKTGVSGATIGGGWYSGTPSIVAGIDPDKTYRFILPVRRLGGDSTIFWGIDGASVATINTTTLDSNPYFARAEAVDLATDRWYLFVGYVYPRNSIYKDNSSAGVYDCRTGKKITGPVGTNFCFLPGFTSLSHRAYQYYGSTDSSAIFGKPMINVVDGAEPELSTFFEVTSSLEDVSLDWTGTGGHIAQGNSITKTLGAATAWDSKAITKQSYKSNAFISGRLETDGFIGLHELGNTSVSYTSMEHSVHRSGDGNWYYWSGAASVLNMGTSRNGITFGNLTDWALFYDNATLKIFADGVDMGVTATVVPDRTYQGCVALYSQTHLVSNVRFGPFTENTMVTTLPPDSPLVINATSAGSVIAGQFNKVMTPTVKRGGADFRTNNRMTYSVTEITTGLTGYVSVNNTTGSSGKGQVTITNIDATGTYKLNIFYDGVLLNAYVLEVKIVPAPPSLGGGGGGGTKSGSVSIGGVSMDTTTFIELGRIEGLVKAAGETIKCTLASGTFTHYAGGTFQSRNVTGKFQYSVAGAESWTDVGSGVTSSAASDWDPELFYSSPGYLTVVQNVAPANNTYDIRFVCGESTTGTGATSFDIYVTVNVIIEV